MTRIETEHGEVFLRTGRFANKTSVSEVWFGDGRGQVGLILGNGEGGWFYTAQTSVRLSAVEEYPHKTRRKALDALLAEIAA